MLAVARIPETYLTEMLQIEQRSNPYPWSAENLRNSYYQFAHLGLFDGTQLVAFVLYQQITDQAEIIHLVCDKAHQGKGYANQLMTAFRKQLYQSGIDKVFLEVREHNDTAQQLYTRQGFCEIGRRKAYYQNREDAILMTALLSKEY